MTGGPPPVGESQRAYLKHNRFSHASVVQRTFGPHTPRKKLSTMSDNTHRAAASARGGGAQAKRHEEKQQQAGEDCLPVSTLGAGRPAVCQGGELEQRKEHPS